MADGVPCAVDVYAPVWEMCACSQFLQNLAIGLYCEPYEFSSHLNILFLRSRFNVILPLVRDFPKSFT